MSKIFFGKTRDGLDIYKYTLKNSELEVSILNYGGIITNILTSDRDGKVDNVVLNYDNIESYEENAPYFGCITGRNAGRIKDGVFNLNNSKYTLAINNGANHLHGGITGLNKRVWNMEHVSDTCLSLSYLSPHLEEGYPGEVKFTVTYKIDGDTLSISYCGVPDRDTIINLTNHSYFNLSGNHSKNILNHTLLINSDKIAPLDESGAVSKTFLNVEGTPFDFRKEKEIGVSIDEEHPQLIQGKGYDHSFILNGKSINNKNNTTSNANNNPHNSNSELKDNIPQMVLYDDSTGRVLEVKTTEDVVVMYTANYLEQNYRCGVCLETQNIPDYVNMDNWEKVIYNSSNIYKSETKYQFKVRN